MPYSNKKLGGWNILMIMNYSVKYPCLSHKMLIPKWTAHRPKPRGQKHNCSLNQITSRVIWNGRRRKSKKWKSKFIIDSLPVELPVKRTIIIPIKLLFISWIELESTKWILKHLRNLPGSRPKYHYMKAGNSNLTWSRFNGKEYIFRETVKLSKSLPITRKVWKSMLQQ